ncbi:MAG: shikimate dehydrogenase [Parvularculaceae bacterium]|nr:shikimate dehydrogenase [Parvularculaceae bacterium]
MVTRTAGVIGWPVTHSLSPVIHETWAQREGRAIRYERLAVEPDDAAFRDAIERLVREGWKGANVTLPHKERALAIADEASGEARAAGAANMLTFSGRAIRADNSDIIGFAQAVAEAGVKPSRALLLGAGGAARGVAIALERRLGVKNIVVANRTRARAEDVARLCGGAVVDWEARADALDGADLLVNATSLGMAEHDPLDIDLTRLSPGAAVADIVYVPLETPLLRAARAKGCTGIDGLAMLMHQAVPAYEAWLGATALVDAGLRARLEAALRLRSNP